MILPDNDLLVGGLLLGAVGSVIAMLRNLPTTAWSLLKRQVVLEASVVDDSELFHWIKRWFMNQEFVKERWTLLNFFTTWDKKTQRQEVGMSPGVGSNWFKFEGIWILVTFDREAAPMNGWKESFTFRCRTRSKHVLLNMMESCRRHSCDDSLTTHIPSLGHWVSCQTRFRRPLSSVILAEGLAEKLLVECMKFLASEDEYIKKGQPHRMGLLLEGPPGNGKTSLATALASELEMDIYVLILQKMSDADLQNLAAALPRRSLLLIEDLDRTLDQLGKEHWPTMSGLLNMLDGVAASEGRITIITANEPDKFPDVLVRPGRIDSRIYIDNPNQDQVKRLSELHEQPIPSFYKGDSMATVRGRLL